jgi:hypothetical protein
VAAVIIGMDNSAQALGEAHLALREATRRGMTYSPFRTVREFARGWSPVRLATVAGKVEIKQERLLACPIRAQ